MFLYMNTHTVKIDVHIITVYACTIDINDDILRCLIILFLELFRH